mmetsp:Transcript_3915/g.6697  ORF Transcript_3915/g.6697 Transcript_3915/m.6697 type:complete len:230 (-) Transcript_3915:462-1151(-)|eukprot:CAMPEP_0198203662 /NCGR_PEP_ID=MMETSP1445-20131203/6981_1 /TAXON_ID=36898 /ORGANISM="Pyramimonas sp., Strain CCMP2087" /LENGTH=229 /DNA_ID=CAMNT_0043875145 /DNA_START=156 /DNA_END=845 /DNA_ORIENTATION=-
MEQVGTDGTVCKKTEKLEHLIGDYRAFIDQVCERLQDAGMDVVSRGYEMDHICYRCETLRHYRDVLAALVPTFGTLMVEGMIGGRPIATICLQEPIVHRGLTVPCLEVPCPKPGRPYPPGLEHAELVVGSEADGVRGKARLREFMAACERDALRLQFDTRALDKAVNADVSVDLRDLVLPEAGRLSVKFHQRPLQEVVEYELSHGEVVLVPETYFAELDDVCANKKQKG